MKREKLVLFGDGAFAEVAYEYFTYDSDYEVVAFTISKEFIKKDNLFGLPIIPFEEVHDYFPPSEFKMHIALVYNQLNRLRMRFYNEAKALGYTLVNYISTKAFIWHNVQFGDNCFIFEDNTVQPFVKMGSNNVFWSGNHIGHHSTIGSHNFISSHIVISGFCNIGCANFIGVNSTMGNNLNIGNDCFIGSFVHITKSVPSGTIIKGLINKTSEKTTWKLFNINKYEMD
jgi:sugar O-acyltransferase (sialic acid O-acetyltransferase NeuD family)